MKKEENSRDFAQKACHLGFLSVQGHLDKSVAHLGSNPHLTPFYSRPVSAIRILGGKSCFFAGSRTIKAYSVLRFIIYFKTKTETTQKQLTWSNRNLIRNQLNITNIQISMNYDNKYNREIKEYLGIVDIQAAAS